MSENKTPKFLSVVQAGSVLHFTLGNGKTLAFDSNECAGGIREQAAMHGFKQKIADSVAGLSKGEQYAEAYAELADVMQSLREGEWNRRGTGGGQVMQDLIEAIAKIKKQPVEKVAAAVQKADAEQRKVWAKNPAVAAAMTEAKAKRLKEAAKEQSGELEIDLG